MHEIEILVEVLYAVQFTLLDQKASLLVELLVRLLH